ncbi:MAG: hypothetical protein KC464_24835 [Myxococcales bacterium]|nr:hypothetical protein [Myxococcales bacterium]
MKPVFDSIDRLGDALAFHRERHAVLAGNVANVDTPGYQPVDLAPVEGGGTTGLAMRRTDAGHLAGPATTGGARVITDPSPAGADGNAVDLERELAKVDANRVRYGACAELATRRLALLRYAASDGK